MIAILIQMKLTLMTAISAFHWQQWQLLSKEHSWNPIKCNAKKIGIIFH